MNVGDELEVSVDKLVYGGEGLARANDRVLFIAGAAPGDRLRVRITEVEKRLLRAEIVKITTPSPQRRTPPCHYFGSCGGCQLQHLPYSAQLSAKAEFIRDALARIGHIEWPLAIEVKHADEFGYRSRAQLKIGRGSRPLQIGFYRAGTHEVCDIDACPILAPELNEALAELRNGSTEIANSAVPYTKLELTAGTGGVSSRPAVGRFSTDAVVQHVRGIDYHYDPECFFQVNRLLLETLIDTALDARTGRLAIDLYAGVGLFALQMARRYQKVMATEVSPAASHWGAHNIRVNNIDNVEFSALSAERWLSRYGARLGPVDLLVLDPPRAGASRKVIDEVVKLAPAELVYVSCDPATLARDLRLLIDNGYRLNNVTGVDLFPQTYHIETVAALARAA